MALEEPTPSNSYCYHDQLTDKVNSWLGSFLKSSTEATAAGILITAGLIIAATAGGPVTLGCAVAITMLGVAFAAHASGLFDDPLNPVNWLDFAATVGSAVFFKAPIGASPFKILTSEFCKKYVKGMVFRYGNRYYSQGNSWA